MHSRLYNTLLKKFRTPEEILSCNRQTLIDSGIDACLAKAIYHAGGGRVADTVKASLDKCLSWLETGSHALLTCQSPDYPPLLSEIPDPPPLLYVIGDPAVLQLPLLAIVGSRNPTAGGRRNARSFARELAASGVGISSGLALGIDAQSHQGALDEKGATVAVLGTGIDIVYPAGNRALFGEIAERGALISEFNPGMPPLPGNFPRRNRIISGLSLGVLVVEAGLKSGSMITARFALEQGREVFAIPGSIHNPLARGCHKLIADGAKLTQNVDDIIEECAGVLEKISGQAVRVRQTKHYPESSSLPKEMKTILTAIGYEPVTLETLIVETGLAPQQASVALVDLELEGFIKRENGGYMVCSD